MSGSKQPLSVSPRCRVPNVAMQRHRLAIAGIHIRKQQIADIMTFKGFAFNFKRDLRRFHSRASSYSSSRSVSRRSVSLARSNN